MTMKTIVRHRDEGPATWFLNALVETKADYAETGGAYYLMEHLFTAASNPPVHIHCDEEEAFYLLEGEMEIDIDGVTAVARPGSFVLAPRGLPHAFRVLSETARILSISSSPTGNTNGGFPQFLQEVGEPAKVRALPEPQAPDPAVLMAAAAEHALEILPPPGA